MSYNIHGRKVEGDLLRYCEKFDIIILSETHLIRDNVSKNMMVNWIINFEKAKKIATRGRASGGMIIAFKKELSTQIQFITGIKNGMGIRIGKDKFIIPTYLNCTNWKNDLLNLENRIQEINEENIMVIGDLNARVGEEQIMEISGRVRDRKSKDKTVNANGRALVSLLDVYDMVILNGTTSSDPIRTVSRQSIYVVWVVAGRMTLWMSILDKNCGRTTCPWR